MLLALSTVPAGAQQQQQPPGCFKVEMSHSTQGNPQGAQLLDRCTGKTWLLLCIRNARCRMASTPGRNWVVLDVAPGTGWWYGLNHYASLIGTTQGRPAHDQWAKSR